MPGHENTYRPQSLGVLAWEEARSLLDSWPQSLASG